MKRSSLVTAVLAVLAFVPFFLSGRYLEESTTSQEISFLPVPPLQKDDVHAETSVPGREIRQEIFQLAKLTSSVDYMACCGLGHRMSKLVDAYYIARFRKFGLRVFFGFCNETTEIFHYFFGAQPLSELEGVTNQGWSFKINNEAPCFSRFSRTGNVSECQCPRDYIEQSDSFYTSLTKRFRFRSEIEDYAKRHHFHNHTVIGLHVRAGNGEKGDFENKNRGIQNRTQWIRSLSDTILNIAKGWVEEPPLLFIATDTASIVQDLRLQLSGHMNVVDYDQERMADGSGIAFGARGSNQLSGHECLLQWKNSLMDMMLLASTDVLIAGRPSSFTQSLPMSVVLSRNRRKIQHDAYCEVSPDATAHQCFDDLFDWCCRGSTKFHLQGIRGYEYRRIPAVDFQRGCKMEHHLHERPFGEYDSLMSPRNQQAKTAFLPYDWNLVQHGRLSSANRMENS